MLATVGILIYDISTNFLAYGLRNEHEEVEQYSIINNYKVKMKFSYLSYIKGKI
ncbi:MAG: hypothetical protein H9872_01050 [Candidatus Cellulosilyticum pullistercoris]|uniref:Uncharacterized protein n=1 Tax=Candidatus Cellulosilyticum pullistercoris TaxID=2838521 RepID=A0A9E2KAB1_9FIRM|nr:hypothetical protein [Candidatus Cellulosilyticum pullistercoris]